MSDREFPGENTPVPPGEGQRPDPVEPGGEEHATREFPAVAPAGGAEDAHTPAEPPAEPPVQSAPESAAESAEPVAFPAAAPSAAAADPVPPKAPAGPPAAEPEAPAAQPLAPPVSPPAPEPVAAGFGMPAPHEAAAAGTGDTAAAGAATAPPGAPPGTPPYGFPAAPYPGYPGFGAPLPAPRRRRPNPLVATAVLTALLAGGLGGGIGAWVADRDDNKASSSVNSTNGPVDPASLNRAPESVAGIAAKALPGTVTIKTKSGTGRGAQEGTGAGFVMDAQGHILTNNHVVSLAADGGELTVTFSDGTTVPGKIVGRAEGYDLAVVKVDGVANLKPLPLGDSANVAVGDAVLAIGSPYGLDGTVTTGIVSAKNRPVASGDQQQTSYMNALQTDASINPGNSGGPLLDAQGRVIGVNSAIRSAGSGSDPFGGQQAGSIGLGFAIPINQAKWVADTLIQTGKPVYAQVGVIPDPEYSGVGARIRPNTVQGQAPVTPGGPADKAGLKAGDVITKLGDRPVTSYEELFSEIWSHKPGEKVKITYQRDGKEATTEVTLGQREGDQSG